MVHPRRRRRNTDTVVSKVARREFATTHVDTHTLNITIPQEPMLRCVQNAQLFDNFMQAHFQHTRIQFFLIARKRYMTEITREASPTHSNKKKM